MSLIFEIINKNNIDEVIPLVSKLNEGTVSNEVLEDRFAEMVTQNYECAVVYDHGNLVGVCGLWYCTRHYSGRSVEPDHVYIEEAYRGKGIGKQFFEWIYAYVISKGCEAVELNTYVTNASSHKFYFNEDLKF